MSDIIIPPLPPPEEPGPKHATFYNAQGKAIAHFTAPSRDLILANLPPDCTFVEGHQSLDHAPPPSLAEKDSDKAKSMIHNLEVQQARAIREERIGRGGSSAELKARLEAIDDQIVALRTKII
jgi:hypothetical protein